MTSFVETIVIIIKAIIITIRYPVSGACYYLQVIFRGVFFLNVKAGGSYEQRKFTIYCLPTFSSNNYVAFSFTKSSIKNDANS